MQAACPVRSDEQLQLYKIFVTCAAYESPPALPQCQSISFFYRLVLRRLVMLMSAPALSLLMASEGDD